LDFIIVWGFEGFVFSKISTEVYFLLNKVWVAHTINFRFLFLWNCDRNWNMMKRDGISNNFDGITMWSKCISNIVDIKYSYRCYVILNK